MGFKMKVFSKINFKWTAAYVVEYQVTLTTIVLVTVYVIYLYLCGIYIYTHLVVVEDLVSVRIFPWNSVGP